METKTPSEEIVYKICKKSFLSLWSYANPQGKEPGKELCDVLVVCEPDIFIFSVKEIRLADSGDPKVDWQRWRRKAIEDSCRQIYGAERHLSKVENVVRSDGSLGLQLPKIERRRIHRIAVALGGNGEVPIEYGDFGKGYVHVFDEASFGIILQELDTVSDFAEYLLAKETDYSSGTALLIQGSEENLLAYYFSSERTFKTKPDMVILDGDLWASFSTKGEYLRKKAADKGSYSWDKLIEWICVGGMPGIPEPGPTFTDEDRAVRVMARETRFNRRVLGKHLVNYLKEAKAKRIRSRIIPSLSGIIYVFLLHPHGTDGKYMQAELGNRCFVARGLHPDSTIVIGIALEEWETGGTQSTLLYLEMPEWHDADTELMRQAQDKFDYFVNPLSKHVHEDEYPAAPFDLSTIKRRIGRNEICPCGSGNKYKRCHGR